MRGDSRWVSAGAALPPERGKNVELRTLRGRKIGGGGNHEWHEGHEWGVAPTGLDRFSKSLSDSRRRGSLIGGVIHSSAMF
jgi:hypothetical protein